jgi:drug/metabolite transporter (DMT)-like permease
MTKPKSAITLAYLCLAAICIIWGTTYTAIKIAVTEFSPFLLAGIRQGMAGLLLLAGARVFKLWQPVNKAYLVRQALTGGMMIAGGNGFITWGLQYVSSGLSAVIGSLTPVVVAIITILWKGQNERFHWLMGFGVLVGFVGLSLIFHDGWKDFANPDYRWGIAGCFASCLTWSIGTVMAKRFNDMSASPVMTSGIQVTSGGIVLLLASLFLEPSAHLGSSMISWLSLVYLIVIGSALAFSLYTFVLKHLDATVSSLYTYVNPIVAIILGWAFLHEKVTWIELIGMLITLFGVYLVNRGSALARA